jgi:cysteinyl-tRNA synthetase
MSMKYLGDTFDLHGGGMDLIFPHHENEIAQAESYSGKPFAKYWAHNGLTRLNTKKLSKSDPEMQKVLQKMTLSHLLKDYGGELLRFFLLSTHYRRPIEFSDEELDSKKKGLDTFYRLIDRVERASGRSPYDDLPTLLKPQLDKYDERYHAFIEDILSQRTRFLDAMDDDFNTAGAISVLFQVAGIINKFMDQHAVETTTSDELRELALAATRTLVEDGRILGLFEEPPKAVDRDSDSLTGTLLDLFVQMRNDAKKEKNYALADKIREQLTDVGVTLEDRPDGTHWRIG